MLVVCRCTKCKKARTYIAADLLPIFGRTAVVGELWGRCPQCGTAEFWNEQERYPSREDVGHTVVRRPSGFRQIQLWRDEYYESPPSSADDDPVSQVKALPG